MRPVGQSFAARVFTPSAIALALASAYCLTPAPLRAQPTGAVAVHGSVAVTQPSAQQTLITTTNGAGTQHSVTNWQSFSVPGGHLAHIAQPSATSMSINRVVSANPSLIYGTLSSNGQVLLVNPAGITVGAGAVVDTAGFLASTLSMSEADAVAGRLRFEGGGAPLQVNGHVVAREGDVVLLAPQVNVGTDALVQAPNGSVALAAGQQIEITGRGLEGIHLQVQAPTDRAVNLGRLQGDAVGMFASTLQHSGAIQATAVSTEGGRVVLKAIENAEVSGRTLARAVDGSGGSIHVTARQVLVTSDAELDVRATSGNGGELLIGGGWQGNDARLTNAETTLVATGARLLADAAGTGDGGTVVIWADGVTRYGGHISARGGDAGGDGGLAEVSGKQWLDFRGTADLTAAQGTKGQLLLDPDNIQIVASNPDVYGDLSNDDLSDWAALNSGNGDIGAVNFGNVTSIITAQDVAVLVQSADLTLAANQWIDVNDTIDTDGVGNNWLTLDAGVGIRLNASVVSGNSLNLELKAGTGGVTQNSGTLDVDELRVNSSGDVLLTAAGNQLNTLSGTLTNGASLDLVVSTFTLPNTITLGALNVAGDFSLVSGDQDVDQSAAIVVSGVTNIDAGTGGVTLNNLGNNFNIFGSTSNGLNVYDSNALALNQINAADDLIIESAGALTRNAGTVQGGNAIDLTAASIGTSSNDLRIASSGSVSLSISGPSSAIYVSEENGPLTTNNYEIHTAGGFVDTVRLTSGSVLFNGFNGASTGVTNDQVVLVANTGDVTVQSGQTLTAWRFEFKALSATGNVSFGDSAGTIALTTNDGAKVFTGGGDVTQTDTLTLFGGFLDLTVGGDVVLSNSNNVFAVTGSVSGDVTLTGVQGIGPNGLSAGGDIELASGVNPNLNINGALLSSAGVVSASASGNLNISSSGSVSASQIELTGTNINVDGKLYPGRDGVAGGQLTLLGNTTFGSTAQLHIDFDGASYDSALADDGFTANFLAGSRLFANAITQPPAGSYTVFTGDTLGTLPTLAGTVANASLSVGSIVVTVSPAPAAVPLDTQTIVGQLAGEFTPLFDQEVGDSETEALPETVTDPRQVIALASDDIVVDDVSCRPR